MKNLLIVSILILFSCSGRSELKKNQQTYPYIFIDSKIEDIGTNTNKMDLYSFDSVLYEKNLKEFCALKREEWKSGAFYFLVIFDSKENAGFPLNPLTALYLEEEAANHIKAIYTYNRLNGYSKLEIYEKNYYESTSKEIEI